MDVAQAYAARAEEYAARFDTDPSLSPADAALVRRHLTGLAGPVVDLGCGPGQWTAYLHGLGADVTGIDLVPEFVAHARAAHPDPAFRLGDLTALDLPDHSVAGVLSWFSTLHLPPPQLPGVLAGFHRVLAPGGRLVLGFFDSADEVAPFDHAVTTAYRWPVDLLAQELARAGFTERERLQWQTPDRPDRAYAALAADRR